MASRTVFPNPPALLPKGCPPTPELLLPVVSSPPPGAETAQCLDRDPQRLPTFYLGRPRAKVMRFQLV